MIPITGGRSSRTAHGSQPRITTVMSLYSRQRRVYGVQKQVPRKQGLETQLFLSFSPSLPGVEGAPFSSARLTARGSPAERVTEAGKINSLYEEYEKEQSTALIHNAQARNALRAPRFAPARNTRACPKVVSSKSKMYLSWGEFQESKD